MSRFAFAIVLAASIGCIAASAAMAQPFGGDTISGTVAPRRGVNPRGMTAMACPEPYDRCNRQGVQAYLRNDGSFIIHGLNPRRRYRVAFWKDLDRNGWTNPGDLIGMAYRGRGIRPGGRDSMIPSSEIRFAIAKPLAGLDYPADGRDDDYRFGDDAIGEGESDFGFGGEVGLEDDYGPVDDGGYDDANGPMDDTAGDFGPEVR
jgi:hypothetical protein